MIVALSSKVSLVVLIERACDYTPASPPIREIVNSDIQALSVALDKALSDLSKDVKRRSAKGFARARVVEVVAIEDTVNADGL